MKTVLSAVLLFVVVCIAFAQPYEPSVIWDRSGETDSSAYGWRLLPLGDQNGDGFSDWAVYARGNLGGWHGTREGYVEFFHGGTPPADTPYFVLRLDTNLYKHIWGASSVDDLNHDGYTDWLMPYESNLSPATYREAVYFGGPGDHSQPDLVFSISYQTFGLGIGDFNGDTFDDLLLYDFGSDLAEILFGGVVMDTIPDWTLHQPPPGQIQSYPQALGDFTGDGASDFLCFNPNNDSAAIFLGGTNPDTIPDYLWGNMTHGAIGGVRDLNNDGYDEFLFRSNASASVHLGRLGLSPIPDFTLDFSCAAGSLVPISTGDFNHDNYDDLILLTSSCSDNMFGSLAFYLGYSWLNADPVFVIDGWTPPFDLIGIYSAAGLGDVNGDGIDDIAVGAWDDFAYLGWRGRCIIFAGDDSLRVSVDDPRPAIPSALKLEVYPNPFNSETTIKLEMPPSSAQVTLTIYNTLGREVRHQELPAFVGEYAYRFSAQDLASGLYLVHAQSGEVQTTQKLMVLK